MTTWQNLRLFIGMLYLLVAGAAIGAEKAEQRILLKAGDIAVTATELQQDLLAITAAERAKVLSGPETLKEFLRRIYQSKNMTAAAERLKLPEDPDVQAQLAAERQRILTDALREYTRKQMQPPDFAALAREHYAVRRDEFQLPEQFRAMHILKQVKCVAEREEKRRATEQLRERLLAGEDFAALARTESDDAGSAIKGGDLGRWLKRADLVAPFADALAALEIGQLSGVVETEYGFHLIKKLDAQPARLQGFDEVREKLEQRLQQTWIQDQLMVRAADYLPPPDALFDESAVKALLPAQ